jgi:glycosyltransferase involved in cell wall biosynthesis
VKISILGFDLASNATGRADLLARLLAPRYEVEVVGPQFGLAPWPPSRHEPVAHRAMPAGRYPAFVGQLPALLRQIDGDLIYASKPRPTSFGLGLLKRIRGRRPVLLDIDDWEIGCVYGSDPRGRLGRVLNVSNPNGLPWTWLMERLVPLAAGITVASRFLEARFGGTLIPHVRDTDAWIPDRYDPEEGRARLEAGKRRIVMFLGPPRADKGIEDLIAAIEVLGRQDTLLALVGASRRLPGRPGVTTTGNIPFDEVPRFLAAADVVVVPQRATFGTRGQVPATLFDAMAMGRPIISTRVSMIPEILEGCGILVEPGNPWELAAAIDRVLANPAEALELGARARARCEQRYSFTAARTSLFPLMERVAASMA